MIFSPEISSAYHVCCIQYSLMANSPGLASTILMVPIHFMHNPPWMAGTTLARTIFEPLKFDCLFKYTASFITEANTTNPDQTAPKGFGSTLFATQATKVHNKAEERTDYNCHE